MTRLTMPLFALAAALAAPAALAGRCATLDVNGVRPDTGTLFVAAYASEADFSRKPVTGVAVAAGSAPRQMVRVCDLPDDGPLAFLLYQDLDGDKRMGRNAMGMPIEPWGSSGSGSAFGPSWAKAQVQVGEAPLAVEMSQ